MCFRTALAAEFRREYKNKKFYASKVGGIASLPPSVSQIQGKYSLVTRATAKQ